MTDSWAYRCGECDALIGIDDVRAHTEMHRRDPDWSGVLEFRREDLPPEMDVQRDVEVNPPRRPPHVGQWLGRDA